MFGSTKAFSGFAVDDLEKARAFYGDTLGMELSRASEEYPLLTLHISGGTNVLIYEKPDHEPAGYTILNFPVADIAAAVDDLTARGVEMKRYDGGMEQDERGIARDAGPLIGWFEDPAGNMLSVLED